ncbi:MAG: peptide chain release factor N(5)-glutamine methyltransferase [Paracoccus sp. (in: a-proteobacteria)]|nr:peptide chain release factor N(5)-glutamine methyltransferase [Paracoccus sp. (in: a-proteobacteria)]
MTTGMALCLAAQDRLEAAGIEGAERDATLLFLEALQRVIGPAVKRHHLAAHLSDPAPEGLEQVYTDMIKARAARQPVAQIIGRRAFWKHEFRVTPDVLDPRPDTETLIEAALDLPWSSLLDLGTGSGAILLSLLAERAGTRGLGVDLSPRALEVARDNAARLGISADFAVSDWFGAVEGRFDLIVSNPPYIATHEMAGLAPEVRDHEPHMALTDGGDGLQAYRAIASGAGAHLRPGGAVLVEIGPTQADQVSALFRQAGFGETRVFDDLDSRPRVVLATNPA